MIIFQGFLLPSCVRDSNSTVFVKKKKMNERKKKNSLEIIINTAPINVSIRKYHKIGH